MKVKHLLIGLLALAGSAALSELWAAAVKLERPAETKTDEGKAALLRCWQYGQLILEEARLEVPAEALGATLKLRKAEGDRAAVYLFDTKNATCLITGPNERAATGKPAARNDFLLAPGP